MSEQPETIRIRPVSKEAFIPDDAAGARLPFREEGVVRPRNAHWLSLLAHGDVVEVEHPAPAAPSKRK